MRIVIDLQGAQTESKFRGIGRYSLSLAKAIARNRKSHEVYIVLNGLLNDRIEQIRADFKGLLPEKNVCVWHAPGPVRECDKANVNRRKVAELIREAYIASLKPDVIHISSIFEGYADDAVTSISSFTKPIIVSVSLYDFIPLLNSIEYLDTNPTYKEFYMRKFEQLKNGNIFLAISEYSKNEGEKVLSHNKKWVINNVSTAADSHFKELNQNIINEEKIRNKFCITRAFVLHTGGADKRKNLFRLIQAYSRLAPNLRESCQLVLAGKIAENNVSQLLDVAQRSGLREDELILTGYISDLDLVQLYNLCELYVFPSWHEGFGLPALEAMLCGAPTIGSDTTSVPEVIGNKNALFDPYSENSILEKISEALTSEEFRQELIEKGNIQAKMFSWDKTALKAIKSFEINIERVRQEKKKNEHYCVKNELINLVANECQYATDCELVAIAKAFSLNFNDGDLQKIYVDISQLILEDFKTGIQRVVRSVIKEWLLNVPKGWIVEPVYLTDKNGVWEYRRASKFKQGILTKMTFEDDVVEPEEGDIFVGLDLVSAVCEPISLGVFSKWRERGVKIVFVVYDILPILFPQWWPTGGSETHTRWLTSVLTVADNIVCISKSVSLEVKDWNDSNSIDRIGVPEFTWFHLGSDVDGSEPTSGMPENSADILKVLGAGLSFLIVGSIEPRKGVNQVLKAFDELWKNSDELNLVIVGKQGWLVDELISTIKNHSGLGKNLFWLDGISDEYLQKIYEVSDCLIAPSEGEGFGLPLIEAAGYEKPIIARNIPVFREVAGENALYFENSNDPDVIVECIKLWEGLFKKNNHQKSGKMNKMTWEMSAKNLMNIILGRV